MRSRGIKIKTLGFNNALEFASKVIETQARIEGVGFRYSPPYTLEQNGKIKRAGRLLIKAARAICIKTKIPEGLWPLFIEALVYINNRLPTKAIKDFKSPIQAIYKAINVPYKPYLQYIRTQGCITYIRIPDQCKGVA